MHALNEFIQDLNDRKKMDGFNIIQDNFYMLFLGDYTDRGYYGAEVWYTILRLKLANPDRVYMVRGNHEDTRQNASSGFLQELQTKFGGNKNNLSFLELQRLYNLLPLALYLGSGSPEKTNYLLCCHGGLELGFDPKPLLEDQRTNVCTLILNKSNRLNRACCIAKLSALMQEAIRKAVPEPLLKENKITEPVTVFDKNGQRLANQIGFMWNDFIGNLQSIVRFENGRGWAFGKELTHETLKAHSTPKHRIKGVFRAHQHGELEMMNRILNNDNQGHEDDAGVGKLWTDHKKIKTPQALWQDIVCTFLVAPALFGKIEDCSFNYDAFGILKVAPNFKDWRLEMIRLAEHQTSQNEQSIAASSSSSACTPKHKALASTINDSHLSNLFGD